MHRSTSTPATRALTAVLLTTATWGIALAQDVPVRKQVLLLNSFHRGLIWTDDLTDGIEQVLRTAGGPEVQLSVEYLDTGRVTGDAYFRKLRALYAEKFAGVSYDLVMCSGDPAFNFLLECRDELLPDPPIVFCGLKYFDESLLAGQRGITGVIEGLDLYRTLDTALELHPGASEVVIVNDQTTTGLASKRLFEEKVLPYFARRVRFSFLEDVTLAELQVELSRLSPQSIVLLLSFTRDRTGKLFAQTDSVRLIAAWSAVPVYGVRDYYVGRGIVGGMVTSGRTQGETAAQLAQRILGGEAPEHIPIVKRSPNRFVFDYRQLTRFGLAEEQLPLGSVVINRPPNFLTVPRTTVWAAAGSGAALTLIIVFLLLYITARRRAERERRELQYQMQQAQKLESLGVMAGGIAHDFNNLLMGILGNASLALVEAPEGSKPHKGILEIQKTARRAAQLTNQLLAYSGRGRLITQPTNLSKLVTEMEPLVARAVSKRATLIWDLAPELPAVDADLAQMRQVIMNLLINASEAIDASDHDSGTITIRTHSIELDDAARSRHYFEHVPRRGLYVALEIHDTGCGIDQATIERVFDPFYTTKFTGRGLGLAAVLGIVRGHKGTIRIQSEPSRGTTIQVLFPEGRKPDIPEVPAPDPAAAVKAQSRSAEEWHPNGTVLVVDDEEGVREVCKALLEREGFTVLTACDGQDGVNVFRANAERLVLVVLDLTMPRMDGIQALDQMRHIRDDVPIILSSGYTEHDATSRFARKGFHGFIHKPYSPQKLMSEIRRLVSS